MSNSNSVLDISDENYSLLSNLYLKTVYTDNKQFKWAICARKFIKKGTRFRSKDINGENGAKNHTIEKFWYMLYNFFRKSMQIKYPHSPYNAVVTKFMPYVEILIVQDISEGIPLTIVQTPISITMNNSKDGYQCRYCGKVFAYHYYLEKHLKYTKCVDQGNRKFPCNMCARSFEKRDRLRIHILHVHDKHRPHKCAFCGKCFSQSSSLNKHVRVHSGERPYKCLHCTKAFTASSILRTHVRQHSGEKPFKCKFCGRAFASHAAHDSHVKRNHA